MGTRFWLEDPRELISSSQLIPNGGMTEIERLNSLSRLVIVTALVLLFFSSAIWLYVLIIGLLLIAIQWYTTIKKIDLSVAHYQCEVKSSNPNLNLKRRGSNRF